MRDALLFDALFANWIIFQYQIVGIRWHSGPYVSENLNIMKLHFFANA